MMRLLISGPPLQRNGRSLCQTPGTEDTLSVDFGEPLDFALLERLITITGPQGPVEGSAEITKEETRWVYTPATSWPAGRTRLVVNKSLEDLAGNRIGRPFDFDMRTHPAAPNSETSVSVPFRIR